jgi:hypothetical protein
MSRTDRRLARKQEPVIQKKPFVTHLFVWLFIGVLVLSLLALAFTTATVPTH